MFGKLRHILSRVDADYADLRYEMKNETSIVFNGRELTQIGSNSTDGFVLRVLKKGGLASFAFTKDTDAEAAVRTAEENALLISKNIKEPVRFAATETVKETVRPKLEEDPRAISMDEKLELTRHYNDIPLRYDGIATTRTEYFELIREKYFVSSEGSEVREDLVTTKLASSITSKEGALVQNVGVGVGGSHGFQTVRNQEGDFEKKAAIALNLLKAKPVDAGTYDIIVNPRLGGVFTHEAYGHFSEADLIEDVPSLREKMKLGVPLGREILNITDDPTLPNQLGHYTYDDEGVAARRTPLMTQGVVTGRLHSRRTAAAFGEPLSGHSMAEDYRFAPIIRMGNIFIEPGPHPFEALLELLGDGLYLLDSMGGQTSGETFTFGAQYGYVIRGGRVTEMIRDVNMSGNLYHTLQHIQAVGNDLTLSKVGGCGKGQMNYRSSNGGPHVLIRDVVIGGR